MTLIGFGCSFTYGSELLDPDLDNWDRHPENNPYRLSNCWLGKLATKLGVDSNNLAEPGCSNYAIGQIFYDWFTSRNVDAEYIICVGWTATNRMSWWDNGWVHDGFIRNEQETRFNPSFRDWLSYPNRDSQTTEQTKLFVNSVCSQNNLTIIQFDALKNVSTNKYPNYHMQGTSMDQILRTEGDRLGKQFLAPGGHPNELGHAYYVTLLTEWIKGKNIV